MKKILLSLLTFFCCIGFVFADDVIEEPIEEPIIEEPIDPGDDPGGGSVTCTTISVSGITKTVTPYSDGYYIEFSGFDSLIPDDSSITGYFSFGTAVYNPEEITIPVAGAGYRWNELHEMAKVNGKWRASVPSEWVLTNNTSNIRLSFGSSRYCFISDQSIALTKPNPNGVPINERYTVSFDSSDRKLNIVGNDIYTSYNLTIKAGTIKDMTILNKLKNGTSGAYDDLLTYAQNDNKGLGMSYVNLVNGSGALTSYSYAPVKNVVYYFYIKYNGDYTNTDGIIVVQGADNELFTTSVNYNTMTNSENTANLGYAITYEPTCTAININNRIAFSLIELAFGDTAMSFAGISSLVSGSTINDVYISFNGEVLEPGHGFGEYPGGFNWNILHKLDKNSSDGTFYLSIPSYWPIYDGYDDITFTFYTNNYTCYESARPLHVTKPNVERPGLGEKYEIELEQDGQGRNIYKMYGKSVYEFSSASVKIGKIEDLEILRSLKNGDANALENLLVYARNDDVEPTSYHYYAAHIEYAYINLDIEEDSFYYFYVVNDDTLINGSEDVYVFQGANSSTSSPKLTSDVDYGVLGDALGALPPEDTVIEEQEDSNIVTDLLGTIVNPSTGLTISIIGLSLLTIVFVIINRFNKKKIFKL